MSRKKELPHSTNHHAALGAVVLGAAVVGGVYFALPALFAVSYTEAPASPAPLAAREQKEEAPRAAHVARPQPLKGIYMSQCVSGTPSMRDALVEFIDTTELNAIVIDVKDFTGKIAFPTDNPLLAGSVSDACGARDMQAFVERLHEKGIYVIARITVFQDPHYTSEHPELAVQKTGGGVWKDRKGLAFVDVGAKPFWDYIVELGKITYALGFDELNFDYVRYPSDGDMTAAVYSHSAGHSKPEMLEEFFSYLSAKLRPTGAKLSADLFGMTATNYDDLNIGQVLERALPYFDGVYPMVYPSHYPKNFHGWSDPNAHSYDIIKYSMDTAAARAAATTTKIAGKSFAPIASTSPASPSQDGPQLYNKPAYDKNKIVPWLQSFDYPTTYTPEMVRAQIQATYDAGLDSWIFWDAANKYRSLRQVLAE